MYSRYDVRERSVDMRVGSVTHGVRSVKSDDLAAKNSEKIVSLSTS